MGKKLPQRFVRNAGVFYVCHRLSQRGWDATPKMRYAKGPNVAIHSEAAARMWRLKVRSLSKRDPVPLGVSPEIDADWVVVCTGVREDSPRCYVLTSGQSAISPTVTSKVRTNWCTDAPTRFTAPRPFYDCPANRGKDREPTSGLEPLTPAPVTSALSCFHRCFQKVQKPLA